MRSQYLHWTASQERAHALDRQLTPRMSVPDVAAGLVGLHASRQSGPYVSAYARLTDQRNAVNGHDQLLVLRAMRGTLHALPPQMASVVFAATSRQRARVEMASARRRGISPRAIRTAMRSLGERLESGPLSEVEARRDLGPGTLRVLWSQGAFLVQDVAGGPHRKLRRLLSPGACEDWRPPSEQTGEDQLFEWYIAAYGPAHINDWTWWTGWGHRRARCVAERARNSGRVVPVRVEGLSGELLVTAGVAPPSSDEPTGRLDVLAYEDPSVKAYFDSRERYLSGCPTEWLFWHAGESQACVLRDGLLAAVWRYERRTKTVAIAFTRKLPEGDATALRAAVSDVGAWLAATDISVVASECPKRRR